MTSTDGLLLSNDWLDAWLAKLPPELLRAYLLAARALASRPELDRDGLIAALEPAGDPAASLAALVERGLIERRAADDASRPYHLPFSDARGRHRKDPIPAEVQDALDFQGVISEELLRISTRDDTAALRAEYFERYPDLRVEWEVYEETKDEDSPGWRLWLELSRLLLHQFESRFGHLKASHNAIFKETASQILSHKVEVIDAVTKEVFSNKEKIFPEVSSDWLVTGSQADFQTHPTVLALAERYDVGTRQIFVNSLELLAQNGFVAGRCDKDGRLIDLLLPSTTGLTKSEERILFLTPEEREGGSDTDRNRERARRAANKYANHLMDRGVAILDTFVRRDRVSSFDALLERIAWRVNEALELIPNEFDREAITLEHVLEKYNDLRVRRSRP